MKQCQSINHKIYGKKSTHLVGLVPIQITYNNILRVKTMSGILVYCKRLLTIVKISQVLNLAKKYVTYAMRLDNKITQKIVILIPVAEKIPLQENRRNQNLRIKNHLIYLALCHQQILLLQRFTKKTIKCSLLLICSLSNKIQDMMYYSKIFLIINSILVCDVLIDCNCLVYFLTSIRQRDISSSNLKGPP